MPSLRPRSGCTRTVRMQCTCSPTPSVGRAYIADRHSRWSELWWQPNPSHNLLMTRRDFRFNGGALLFILRYIFTGVQKKLAVCCGGACLCRGVALP